MVCEATFPVPVPLATSVPSVIDVGAAPVLLRIDVKYVIVAAPDIAVTLAAIVVLACTVPEGDRETEPPDGAVPADTLVPVTPGEE